MCNRYRVKGEHSFPGRGVGWGRGKGYDPKYGGGGGRLLLLMVRSSVLAVLH